ncbi:MAG: SurA N-terminal domain-containing protein [Candidatus Promineifilaceae bacterium]
MKRFQSGDTPARAIVRFALSFLILLLVSILLVSCNDEEPPTLMPTADAQVTGQTEEQPQNEVSSEEVGSELVSTEQVTATLSPATPTAAPPTATPVPLAAMVNGKSILLADFEKEVARFQQAQAELGLTPDEGGSDITEVVLEALIETEIIAQAAEQSGIVVTDQMVSERIAELKQSVGGDEVFNTWLQANQWTEEEFHQALQTEMITERMVEQITADVPFAVEQVHARYIQVDDAALAQSLLEQARNGADFANLAQQYSLDRITGEDGGDLGYFALGSLLVPEVEDAAFALQPGQLSDVVAAPRLDGSGTVYYLVQLVERDPQREITANLRSLLLQAKFETWLAEQWNLAEVERFVGENQ